MTYFEFCKKYNISLNPEQEKAVLKTNGPGLMVSVPGSGKTTVIITRIAYMIMCEKIPPEKILTVTFSTDAASSMRERFYSQYGSQITGKMPEFRTIHSIALNIVKMYCSLHNKIPDKILENGEYILRDIFFKEGTNAVEDRGVREALNYISKNKNLMQPVPDISISGLSLISVSDKYEKYKKEHGFMDFDDILIYALKILESCPDILEIWQDRFHYFNVDEAQDNSKIQNSIMNALSSRFGNLFMAGDEDQCIYGFCGAYPQAFFEFEDKWGRENIIKLQTNYRSCDQILTAAETFINRNKNRYPKSLAGVKQSPGKIDVKHFNTYPERNKYILKDMKKYNTAAVLSRNNDSLISAAYTLWKNSVSFRIKPGKNDFFSSFIYRDITDILEAAVKKQYSSLPAHLKYIIKNDNRISRIRYYKPKDSLRYILYSIGYSEYLISMLGRGCSVQGICSKLNILETILNDCQSIIEFLDIAKKLKNICSSGSDKGNISLFTCHGSKGLEFDKIYIIDVLDKVFPSCDNITDTSSESCSEQEEEVRLFYVALTRAREEAEILNVKNSYWGISLPSIFVKDIEREILGNEKK
ncbi:MAG: ATP-dependent helicase [Bacillota bacterium]|nr:ATP-dependent helicase [Bacillota bacterium]